MQEQATVRGGEGDTVVESQEAKTQPGLNFYISYASQDRLWAEWVGRQPERAGYTIVLDLWDPLPGSNVILAREDALRQAGRVLALCSAAFFGVGFTELNWTVVMAANPANSPRLVSVLIENLESRQLPNLLRSVMPIKLFGIPEAEASRRLLENRTRQISPSGSPLSLGSAVPMEPVRYASAGLRLPSPYRPATQRFPPGNPDFLGRDSVLVQGDADVS